MPGRPAFAVTDTACATRANFLQVLQLRLAGNASVLSNATVRIAILHSTARGALCALREGAGNHPT